MHPQSPSQFAESVTQRTPKTPGFLREKTDLTAILRSKSRQAGQLPDLNLESDERQTTKVRQIAINTVATIGTVPLRPLIPLFAPVARWLLVDHTRWFALYFIIFIVVVRLIIASETTNPFIVAFAVIYMLSVSIPLWTLLDRSLLKEIWYSFETWFLALNFVTIIISQQFARSSEIGYRWIMTFGWVITMPGVLNVDALQEVSRLFKTCFYLSLVVLLALVLYQDSHSPFEEHEFCLVIFCSDSRRIYTVAILNIIIWALKYTALITFYPHETALVRAYCQIEVRDRDGPIEGIDWRSLPARQDNVATAFNSSHSQPQLPVSTLSGEGGGEGKASLCPIGIDKSTIIPTSSSLVLETVDEEQKAIHSALRPTNAHLEHKQGEQAHSILDSLIDQNHHSNLDKNVTPASLEIDDNIFDGISSGPCSTLTPSPLTPITPDFLHGFHTLEHYDDKSQDNDQDDNVR